MSTTVTPPAESKPFDPLAHMNARNEAERAARTGNPMPGKPKEEPAKPKEEAKAEPVKAEEPHAEPAHRSRRTENRLREEIGELRGRLKAFEEMGAKPKTEVAPPEEDPEPSREKFASDAEYNRALGRWDARQEAKKAVSKVAEETRSVEELTKLRDHLKAMDEKAAADAKLLPDWEEVAKKAAESEDAIEVDWSAQQNLLGLIAASDVKAFVLYHFAKEPAELQKILDLSKDANAQIRSFHRLEGRVEKLYTAKQQETVVQAAEPEKSGKERTHTSPEKAEQAEATAADRDVRKPRPSTEVAARGGSATPEEPVIGSKAWMEQRNRAERAR